MGIFSFFNRAVSLTESNRELIFKLFGSLTANKLNTQNLIEESYNSNTDVYSVIKKIIDVSKSVDWTVEKKQKDIWIKDENNTLFDLIQSPNKTKGYTWDDIEEQLLLFLLTTGNSYIYGATRINRSLIEEIDILPSNFVDIQGSGDFFNPNYKYYFNFNTASRTLDNKYLAHLKYFNPAYRDLNCLVKGLSPIQVASQVVKVGNDTWDATANIYQNRGAIGMISDRSNRPMTPEEADKTQRDFNGQTAGTRNYGKIKVTNKDLNYIQMAMSPQDLQLIEKGVVNLRSICNVFNLDSSLFNDPANKTFNNRLEAEKSMYTNAIIPLSSKVSEMLTRFLAWNHYPNKDYRIVQDFSEVECLQSNKKEEAEKDKIVIEGISLIMEMNISQEAKVSLIKESYDISEETLNILLTTKPTEIVNALQK